MTAYKPVLRSVPVAMESHLWSRGRIDPDRGDLDNPANPYEVSLNPWPALVRWKAEDILDDFSPEDPRRPDDAHRPGIGNT